MYTRQLSVFVENQPGKLCEIAELLGQNNIDIQALSIADTDNYGILRLIVDRPRDAETCLKESGFSVSQTKVLAVLVSNRPGSLAAALRVLEEAGISVEYMYAGLAKQAGSAYFVFRVADNEAAAAALTAAGIRVLCTDSKA